MRAQTLKTPPKEFVERGEELPITEDEYYERFTSPNAISRNLFSDLAAWEDNARRVLSDHGIRESNWPSTWPVYIKTAPAEVQDAWRVLVASGNLRKAMHPKEPHEIFDLAMKGIQLGLAVMEAHTRPFTQPAAIGQMTITGGFKGVEQRYGILSQREERHNQICDRWVALRDLNPDWNHRRLDGAVGKEFGVTDRTVRLHLKKHTGK